MKKPAENEYGNRNYENMVKRASDFRESAANPFYFRVFSRIRG
jgi:hypothetical protein